MKRAVSCFNRLNAGIAGQPFFLASVSSTLLKVAARSRRHGSAAVCENERNGNRLYTSVPTLRYAWPCAEPSRPRKRISEVRTHRFRTELNTFIFDCFFSCVHFRPVLHSDSYQDVSCACFREVFARRHQFFVKITA
jgi:hypothetical protein